MRMHVRACFVLLSVLFLSFCCFLSFHFIVLWALPDININKSSSEDELANVNIFHDDIAHVLQNTKKREPTSFNKLDDS